MTHMQRQQCTHRASGVQASQPHAVFPSHEMDDSVRQFNSCNLVYFFPKGPVTLLICQKCITFLQWQLSQPDLQISPMSRPKYRPRASPNKLELSPYLFLLRNGYCVAISIPLFLLFVYEFCFCCCF